MRLVSRQIVLEIEFLESQHGFLGYATSSWTAHFQAAMIPSGYISNTLALELFHAPTRKSHKSLTWLQYYWHIQCEGEAPAGIISPHHASVLGHEGVVRQLIDIQESVLIRE